MLIPIDHTIYRNVYALQLYAPLNIFQWLTFIVVLEKYPKKNTTNFSLTEKSALKIANIFPYQSAEMLAA